MDNKELRELIEKLHAEIKNTHSVDEKGQELLLHLESDINGLLEQSGGHGTSARASTIRGLEEGLDHFEVTHPALTFLISKLLEALSNVGI